MTSFAATASAGLAAVALLSLAGRLPPRLLAAGALAAGAAVLLSLPFPAGAAVAAAVAVPALLAGGALEDRLLARERALQRRRLAEDRSSAAEARGRELKAARESLERLLAERRAAYRFSRALASVVRFDDFLRALARGVRGVADYRAGLLAVFPGDASSPGLVVGYDVDRAEPLPEGAWPEGWRPDPFAAVGLKTGPEASGGSYVTMVLEGKGRVIGVLSLRGTIPRAGGTGDGGAAPAMPDPAAFLVDALGALRGQVALGLQKVLYYRRVVALSRTDGSTGLAKRWFFMERLQGEVQRSLEERTPLAVVMADVDDFKRVNDRFGHLVGDAVLGATAKGMQAVLRREDLAGRYGGDEFILALPRTSGPAARIVCERIRERLRVLEIQGLAEGVHLTLSLGISVLPADGDSPRALTEAADRRLYQAKGAGKDRVVGGEPG